MASTDILQRLHAVGLTRPEEEMVVLTDEPRVPGYLCHTATSFPLNGADPPFGQGYDLDRFCARIKAVAECLERLCWHYPPEHCLQEGESGCDPELFVCYSDEQLEDRKKFLERLREARYLCCPVTNIATGEELLIPSQLVVLGQGRFDDEPEIRRERITTGAGMGEAGSGRAFSSGLLEVIERDAMISAYLTRRPLRRITGLPKPIADVVDYLERYLLEPYIFDITTDLGVPSVLVITLDRTGVGPAVNTGHCAALSYSDAIERALLESVQKRRSLRVSRAITNPGEVDDDHVHSLGDRINYWWPLERIGDLSFWCESEDRISYGDLPVADLTISQVTETLASRGYHVFLADITRPEMKVHGFEAVKVVIPELHPLYLNEQSKFLFSAHHGTIPNDPSLKPHPFL